MDLAAMREQYERAGLDVGDLDPDPVAQFRRWFDEWLATEPYDASSMVLATVDPDGWPAARAVLLKGIDDRGFAFFTNRASDKGRDLAASPRAALTFVWAVLERQVRVVGDVTVMPGEESDAYFARRPRESRLGAWASDQSSVVADRATLETLVGEAETGFTTDVPRPPHWGGYIVAPRSIEFWQGRPNRIHDRLRYRRDDESSSWIVERLAP